MTSVMAAATVAPMPAAIMAIMSVMATIARPTVVACTSLGAFGPARVARVR